MSQAAGSMDEVPPPNQATTPSPETTPTPPTTPAAASSSTMANRGAARGTTHETARTRAASPLAVTGRPGLVTFAAVMMFVLAGFQFIWALVEFSNAHYLSTYVYGNFSGYLWAWGVFDLLLAVVIAFAGVSLLRGGVYGQIIGLVVACISAIRWFFYIPAEPWMALAVIGIDILIIYGLVAHSEYFGSTDDSTRAGAV